MVAPPPQEVIDVITTPRAAVVRVSAILRRCLNPGPSNSPKIAPLRLSRAHPCVLLPDDALVCGCVDRLTLAVAVPELVKSTYAGVMPQFEFIGALEQAR